MKEAHQCVQIIIDPSPMQKRTSPRGMNKEKGKIFLPKHALSGKEAEEIQRRKESKKSHGRLQMDEDDDDDIAILIAAQQRELMAARDLESDLDLAFRLQMEEAMVASIALQPSTSSSKIEFQVNTADIKFPNLQNLELDRFQQERKEAEMRRITDQFKIRVHDQKFAREIIEIPEQEWKITGDYFSNPFGEGCSSSASASASSSSAAPVIEKEEEEEEEEEPYKLYFKGLVSNEKVKGLNLKFAGIGIAICNARNELVFKFHQPLIGDWKNHRVAEVKALIEGLHAALRCDIKRLNFYCDYHPLYQQLTGRWVAKQRKFATLITQVIDLQSKFISCRPFLVTRNEVKFAFKLAREAIDSQITKTIESIESNENCTICLEDTDASQMFSVDDCLHRYCFSCMKQHVEVKLRHGIVPVCPHEGCNTQLRVDSCRKFLSAKFVELMNQHIKEASIPVMEKIYCPFPKCSALMSKSDVLKYSSEIFVSVERSGVRKCLICHGLFCIHCKVPWHNNKTCHEYKRSNPFPRGEEAKLKSLASQKLWRQCVKCNHMIELAEGCYHMTCRCGYEFCYTCGAEWKDKKATCACKLWDEENILQDDADEDFQEEDEDSENESIWYTDEDVEFLL